MSKIGKLSKSPFDANAEKLSQYQPHNFAPKSPIKHHSAIIDPTLDEVGHWLGTSPWMTSKLLEYWNLQELKLLYPHLHLFACNYLSMPGML